MTRLTQRQALKRLNDAIDITGGVRAYARRVGCSAAYVSDTRLGKRHISGPIAEDLRLRRVKKLISSYIEVEAA